MFSASSPAPDADPAGSTSEGNNETPRRADWPLSGASSLLPPPPPPFWSSYGSRIDATCTIDSDRRESPARSINHDDDLLFRLDVATPTIAFDDPPAFLQPTAELTRSRSSNTPASTLFSRSKRTSATLLTTAESSSVTPITPRTPKTPRTTPRRRRDDSVIMALVHGRGFARQDVGLAAINLTSCELRLSQMNDSQTYTKTLAKLNLYRPVEVLMPDTIACSEPVSALVKRITEFDSEIVITALERSAFNESNGLDCINELSVTDPLVLSVVLEQKFYALAAAAALIHHLEHNIKLSFAPRTLRISYQGTDQTVLIDSETALRLELVCSLDETGNGPSLLSSINYCRTSAGTRMLRSNLLEPLSDPETIEARLNAVEELVQRPFDLYQPMKDNLSRFVDVERAIKQCVVVPRQSKQDGRELSGEFIEQRINAVIGLRHVLTLVHPLRTVLEQAKSPLISQLASELANNPMMDRVLERINQVLEEKAKPTKGKIGMKRQRLNAIRTGADLMLDVCRQTFNQLESELEDYVAELVVKYQIPLALAHTANRGYHLQQTIPRSRKRDNNPTARLPPPMPALPPVFICVKRYGNCLAFTTQHLLVANERLKTVQRDAEQLTDTIIEQLLAEIRQDIASLYKLREIVCQLDVLLSFASYALNEQSRPKCIATSDAEAHGYCRPKFGPRVTEIRCGRHPILDRHSPETLVSNDTDMNEEYHFHVITGAHMSGKSTYIRQVMLLQILAQIGCFIPAKSATFRLVDQMFSRLGTQDRFGNNASSFSLEMMEMNYIVRNAGQRSLVILDELCQNTSRQEGSALCWALCEDLLELGAWVLITTHTPFITRLADIYGPVVNYHMQVVETTSATGRSLMKFTHKILNGSCQIENYGMKLANMVAFPEEIVKRAQDLLPLFEARMKLTLPKVPLECKLYKLNYDLYCRVKDLDARLDLLVDDLAKVELNRILECYTEELSEIIAQHEADQSVDQLS